jgi:hypothetical protein
MPIQNQIRLPFSVAFDVVMQGIRIRLGRALVTLMGVLLGIAFLMSMLTGQGIRRGVSHEIEARSEMKRMLSFLTAETGPLEDRTLAVVAVGPLNAMEHRLLEVLRETHVSRLAWVGTPPAGMSGWAKPTEIQQAGTGATALLVLGEGIAPRVDWLDVLRGSDQPIIASTRHAHGLGDVTGVTRVDLEREWQPDELQARDAEARKLRFRSGWIIAISLLVTVIGVSNAMLMSVTERFREIGTMKCLGALSSFIRRVFFIEASLLGAIGSLLGSLCGALFAVGAYSLTYGGGLVLSSLSLPMLLLQALLAVVAGVGLSVVAAIYPAGVASRMVPATALRSTI